MTGSGIGARLRDERLAQGLSLDDISARTRIQARFLQAIEADDLSSLPGIVFARNFVRQYASALGLDPEPLIAALPRVDQASVPLPAAPPRPRAQRTRLTNPVWTSAGWALAAVAAASGAWVYYNEGWRKQVWESFHRPPAPVASVAASKPAPLPPTAPEAVAPTLNAAQEIPVSAPATSSEAQSPVQVVVTAQEPAWISVTADSKAAFIGILKPHESREISAVDWVKILTGNAGGIILSLNGKTLDPIGPRGQVRTVRLTAEGPELLSKVPDPPVADLSETAPEPAPTGAPL